MGRNRLLLFLSNLESKGIAHTLDSTGEIRGEPALAELLERYAD